MKENKNMKYKVEIEKMEHTDIRLPVYRAVFLLGTNLLVAQGFETVTAAREWIDSYNKKYGREVLELV